MNIKSRLSRFFLAAFIAAISTSTVFANESNAHNPPSGKTGKISSPEQLAVYQNGNLSLLFGEVVAPECSIGKGRVLYVGAGKGEKPVTVTGLRSIQSVVLVAILAGKKLRFDYGAPDAKGRCWVDVAVLHN